MRHARRIAAGCLAAVLLCACRTAPPPAPGGAPRTVRVDLLALDLTTCGRCAGTSGNLDRALDVARDRLRAEGIDVEVQKTVVTTEEQAVRLRFLSSPTIRVDGRDIAFELRENECRDCGDLCGSDGGVDCRVWVWRGREYLDAPVPMIVDAVVREAREPARAAASPPPPFVLPDNLRRFFRARASNGGTDAVGVAR